MASQDIDLAGRDNIDLGHRIHLDSRRSPQLDRIADRNVLEFTKERVSMTRDTDVPSLSRSCCPGNPPDAVV